MESIANSIQQIANEFEDCEIVVALHKNPIVRQTLCPILEPVKNVHLIEPPDYVPFVKLMQRAYLILTDSGGVQEEAPTLGVPILVLRRTTERQEGVDAGTAKLVGTDQAEILREARVLLTDSNVHAKMAKSVNPFGEGGAATQIVQVLRDAE